MSWSGELSATYRLDDESLSVGHPEGVLKNYVYKHTCIPSIHGIGRLAVGTDGSTPLIGSLGTVAAYSRFYCSWFLLVFCLCVWC